MADEVRRVLFIILPYLVKEREAKNSKTRSFAAFPYGVLSIASYLKANSQRSVEVRIFDCNVLDTPDFVPSLRAELQSFKPAVAAISMMFDISYRNLSPVADLIKTVCPESLVLLGGASASASYDVILNKQKNIDAICHLEGEVAVLKLIEAENMKAQVERDRTWITHKSLAGRIAPAFSQLDDLDPVIEIDYELVDVEDYKMKQAFSPHVDYNAEDVRQFFLVTSRGCPFKCVFCSEPSRHGRKVRYAGVDKVISHVRGLVTKYGMNVLTIYDDQFLLNMDRAKEILRRLAEFNLRIECPNGLSVAFVDEEMAYLMAKAGIDTVPLAIESGSPYVLNKIIRKPLRLDQVKPVVQMLRNNGIFVEAFFVSGLPGEKDEHRRETLQFIKEVELDWAGFSLATPVKGSRLYEICIENGYIDRDIEIGEIDLNRYMIRTPDSDPEEVKRQTYLMNLDANFVNNYRMKSGDYVTAARCFKDVIDRYQNHAFAHYFLAEAHEKMNSDSELVAANRRRFTQIIESDTVWRQYAERFDLINDEPGGKELLPGKSIA